MAFPIDLLDKIKDVFEAVNITGGALEHINFIDYGAALPPLASSQFPLIFMTIDTSLHPEMRAARGAEESYDEHYSILVTVASYILKTTSNEGYKAAFTQAANLFKEVLKLCHTNKKWDDLCYTSEASETDPVEWGPVPWGPTGGDLLYGVTLTLNCRIKSTS